MNPRLKSLLLLVVWLLAAGSCPIWGMKEVWVMGLSITIISLSTTAFTFLPDTSKQDKDRYQGGGIIFLLHGLVLHYNGLKNP